MTLDSSDFKVDPAPEMCREHGQFHHKNRAHRPSPSLKESSKLSAPDCNPTAPAESVLDDHSQAMCLFGGQRLHFNLIWFEFHNILKGVGRLPVRRRHTSSILSTKPEAGRHFHFPNNAPANATRRARPGQE